MDREIRDLSKRLAARSLPRRGFVRSLGRISIGASALGLGLTGLPRPLVALAASGAPTRKPKAFPSVPRPIPFDPQHLHDGQEVLPPGAAKGARPLYVTCLDGCNCTSEWDNPCSGCCGSYSGPAQGPYWGECAAYQCCCNPCPDTCCSLGRAMTFQYYEWYWDCCDGSNGWYPAPTGNYGCDSVGTCSQGVPCHITQTCCS